MIRRSFIVALALMAGIAFSCGHVFADSSLAGSSWTVVVSEECQLFQIQKITLRVDGTVDAAAVVEDQSSSAAPDGKAPTGNASGANSSGEYPLAGESTSADLQGTWTQDDKGLHLSLSNGSLTLDGPVKDGQFKAKAMMKTDFGDPLAQDCMLKRN